MTRRIAPQRVEDIMSSRPRTVGPKMTVHELQRSFASYNFNAFPVVTDAAALVGIVTKLDLLRIFRHDRARLRPSLAELWTEHVEDIMRRRVVTLGPRDSVATAIDHNPHIIFVLNVDPLLEIEAADHLSGWARLRRDKRFIQHAFRQ